MRRISSFFFFFKYPQTTSFIELSSCAGDGANLWSIHESYKGFKHGYTHDRIHARENNNDETYQ